MRDYRVGPKRSSPASEINLRAHRLSRPPAGNAAEVRTPSGAWGPTLRAAGAIQSSSALSSSSRQRARVTKPSPSLSPASSRRQPA